MLADLKMAVYLPCRKTRENETVYERLKKTIEMKKSMEQMMGSKVEFWDETLFFSGSKVNGVTYRLEGNKLILDGMDVMDGISISVKSVTSSTLVLREAISMEGIDLTADMEYSKK